MSNITSDAIKIKPKAVVKHYCVWFDFYCTLHLFQSKCFYPTFFTFAILHIVSTIVKYTSLRNHGYPHTRNHKNSWQNVCYCEINLIKFWHCGVAKAMAPALLDCIGNPLTTSWEDCHALSKWMVSVHHHTGVPGFPVWWALNKSRGQIVNISPFIEDSYAGAASSMLLQQ